MYVLIKDPSITEPDKTLITFVSFSDNLLQDNHNKGADYFEIAKKKV